MTRDRRLLWSVVGLVVLVALPLIVVSGRAGGAGSSVLSHGQLGWLLTRQYLEKRGATTRLGNLPLSQAIHDATEVLVVSFPAQRGFLGGELARLNGYLLAGGTLLYAYSYSEPSLAEQQLLSWLGLESVEVDPSPPLNPISWWRQASTPWSLQAEGPGGSGVAPVQLLAPRWLPSLVEPGSNSETQAEGNAEVLFRGKEERAVIFSFRQRRGRVLVLPSEVLASSRLHNPGNADLLESLYRWLGDDWLFDEYRHGLSAPVAVAGRSTRRAFDLICLHLLLCYLLAVLTMSRRLGPAWREQTPVHGSTASFLIGLGRLHDHLGHHRQATELLLERAAELDPGLSLPRLPEPGRSERHALVLLARRVAELQRRITMIPGRDDDGSTDDSAD